MITIFVELSKYLLIILFALYTYECFAVFRRKNDEWKRNTIYNKQLLFMFLIHADAFLVIFLMEKEWDILAFYGMQVLFLIVLQAGYRILYKRSNRLLLNNMSMLLTIGFIMMSRLDFLKAERQFIIVLISACITFLIPFIIENIKLLRNMTWIYGGVGLAMLLIVAILGATSYGAKISFTIAGITLQPTEFVKILFVFFIAGRFYISTEFKQIVITSAFAAAHVLILAASKDLGGALIFFVVYIVMLYVASQHLYYFVAGILGGCVASVVAYKIFSHVRVRVIAWRTPLSVINKEGYQICQSLFAIGTGGWFGLGLYQGMPKTIPVVEQDFMFSAIAEELGGVFAICLIMVCVSCFFMFINIALQMHDFYYKLVALGLGVVYGFQVFLTLGGVTKFIPSTGVTLPFVSYGGSSMLATFIIFSIIQGLYIRRQDEGEIDDDFTKKSYQTYE